MYLLKASREGALSQSIGMQMDGRISTWAAELSRSRAKGADGDWALQIINNIVCEIS